MLTLLILFFASLTAIIIMIRRKLVLLKNGQETIGEEILLEIPYLKKLGFTTVKNIKKILHLSLVAILRFYIRSINFFKIKYEEFKIMVKNWNRKGDIGDEKKEISKFLKIISDYKHKIREIKNKIKREENL